ncbi:hypothetical protein [Nostoc sp. NIES-3756]|uniref:hypothetical protein n=1 Tax=Nostoc sp. NIES-3756 TaxID=1751286 RepID=UPI000837981F|nr:hypothetical protein [Nostoc sp. NIES-3756]
MLYPPNTAANRPAIGWFLFLYQTTGNIYAGISKLAKASHQRKKFILQGGFKPTGRMSKLFFLIVF